MNERDKVLLGAWLGSEKLGDRELKPLGAGRYITLKTLGNGHFCESTDDGDMIIDSIEIVYVMYLQSDEIREYIKKTKQQRNEILADFAAEFSDSIDEVVVSILGQITQRLGAATMEAINNSGKEISRAS
jgi:hypothetical protein